MLRMYSLPKQIRKTLFNLRDATVLVEMTGYSQALSFEKTLKSLMCFFIYINFITTTVLFGKEV